MAFIRRNLPFFLFVMCLLAFRWNLADQYQVPSGSMEPTIEVGDRIATNKMAYDLKLPFTSLVLKKISDPQRGDIIVFDQPTTGLCMVKRLIGLPGDRIEIQDGFIAVNGQPIEGSVNGAREFLESKTDEHYYVENFGERKARIKRTMSLARSQELSFIVPENHYFAMGDNRDNSLDSRSWGFIDRSNLKGRAFGVLYNWQWEPQSTWPQLGRFAHSF